LNVFDKQRKAASVLYYNRNFIGIYKKKYMPMTTHVLTAGSLFNSRMKITLSYVAATAGVVLFSWFLHEFAHW